MNKQLTIESLNPAQLKAATAKLGNLLILAGAGSGKTRVLVHRIEWLIKEHGAQPYNIFAVTFTNKAAAEMRARLAGHLRCDTRQMWIGTFHGLAHKLLRRHWAQCGLPENFQVMDSDDQLRVIKRIFKRLSINEESWEPKQAQSYINRHKDDGKRTKHLAAGINPFDKVMLEIYRVYEQVCQNEGLLDFAELLLRSYELLQEGPELRAYYQQKFRHIFVDEFQDTNKIQYSWLKLLAENVDSVTVVGDDDQSIYGWRGAQVENIFKFEKDYPQTEVLRLEQNYRSTGTILAAANAVIAKNGGRFEKTLWTQADKGEPITLYVALNEEDEALYIAKQIQKHKAAGFTLEDIAILYRSNAQSRVLEEMLLRLGVEYSIYGGLRFFERAEIKDALAYLRMLVNKQDNTAFERAINTPPRGIGARSLEKIRDLAQEKEIPYWEAAKLAVEIGLVTSRAATGVRVFIELITSLEQTAQSEALSSVIEQIISQSGLISFFEAQQGEKALSRVENLKELVNATNDFASGDYLVTGVTAKQEENISAVRNSLESGTVGVEFDGDLNLGENNLVTSALPTVNISSISEFLNFVSLESASGKENKGGVQMMTLHSAKGLEFPMVFMCGVEEGLFPHHFAKDDLNGLEEERRLCYVGITRAKQKLILSYAEVRRLFGREELRRASRFITEIPSELIVEEQRKVSIRPQRSYDAFNQDYDDSSYNRGRPSAAGGSFSNNYHNSQRGYSGESYNRGARSKVPVTVGLAKSRSSINKKEEGSLLLGKRVKHSKFGTGIVVDQEGSEDRTRVNINFDKKGVKWLMLAYANLEVIG